MLGLIKEIFGAQIWQAAILLCTTVVQFAAARFIGPTALGVTAVIVSGASLCFLLIELNLQPALVRAVSVVSPVNREILKGNTFGGRLALAMLLSPGVGLCAGMVSKDHQWTIFVGVVGAVLAQELNPSWWLQGMGKSGRSFLLAGCIALASCVGALPLIYYVRQPGLESLFTSLVGVLLYGTYWFRFHSFSRLTSHLRTKVAGYAKFAWQHRSFLLGGAAVYLYLYPAQLLLASTRSVEEAGLYRVALMPGTAYYAITVAAFNAYYPRVIRAHTASVAEYKSMVRHLALLVAGIGAIAWLATWKFKGLFSLAIGGGFEISVALAPLLVVSKAIGGVGLVARAALLAQARERAVFGVFFLIGTAALASNMVIIPHYGFVGAAVVEITQESLHLLILLALLASGAIKLRRSDLTSRG